MAPFAEHTLEGIARHRGSIGPGGVPDLERAARQFMHDLRTGALGKLTLDAPPVQFDSIEEIAPEDGAEGAAEDLAE